MIKKHPLRAFRDSQIPPLSQAELAEKLGVTKTSICRWENGERFPERQHWQLIREITGISPDDLAASEHKAEKDDPTARLPGALA